MRSTRTLLSLARALAEARPGDGLCGRLLAGEPLRVAHAGHAIPAMPQGLAGNQARGFADGNVPAADRAFEQMQGRMAGEEPSEYWEYGYRTEHTVIADRPRTLEDYNELIGVIARRRRCLRALIVILWNGRPATHVDDPCV